MLKMDKNIHFNATSVLENGEVILNMNADNMAMNLNISKNIQNIELYMENKEIANADFAEFESKVLEAIQE